jgi:hypothetical protein
MAATSVGDADGDWVVKGDMIGDALGEAPAFELVGSSLEDCSLVDWPLGSDDGRAIVIFGGSAGGD